MKTRGHHEIALSEAAGMASMLALLFLRPFGERIKQAITRRLPGARKDENE